MIAGMCKASSLIGLRWHRSSLWCCIQFLRVSHSRIFALPALSGHWLSTANNILALYGNRLSAANNPLALSGQQFPALSQPANPWLSAVNIILVFSSHSSQAATTPGP